MEQPNNKTNKINKAWLSGKLDRYGMTKRSIYSMLSVIACIGFIIVLSIAQATFNPEKLKSIAYWVNLSIQVAVSIFGMIAGKQAGDDMGRNAPDGQYRTTLRNYGVIISRIKELEIYAYLSDWLVIYREKKLKEKIKNLLYENGIKQLEVLDLDFSELDCLLEKGYMKDWSQTPYRAKYFNEKEEKSITYFVSYTREQIALIRFIKEGKVKVSEVPISFFISAINESTKDMWESSAKANKKKGLYLGSSYLYKIISLAFVSVMTAGLEPLINGGTNQSQVWLDTISRIFTLILAVVWGFFIGMELVKIDLNYLEFKQEILNLYLEEYRNKIFVPKSVEEKAKEQYKERMEKKYSLAIIEDKKG